MNRKEFELIAGVLRERRESAEAKSPGLKRWEQGWRAAHTALALDFADALAETNSRFDRVRFLAACGVEGGENE